MAKVQSSHSVHVFIFIRKQNIRISKVYHCLYCLSWVSWLKVTATSSLGKDYGKETKIIRRCRGKWQEILLWESHIHRVFDWRKWQNCNLEVNHILWYWHLVGNKYFLSQYEPTWDPQCSEYWPGEQDDDSTGAGGGGGQGCQMSCHQEYGHWGLQCRSWS